MTHRPDDEIERHGPHAHRASRGARGVRVAVVERREGRTICCAARGSGHAAPDAPRGGEDDDEGGEPGKHPAQGSNEKVHGESETTLDAGKRGCASYYDAFPEHGPHGAARACRDWLRSTTRCPRSPSITCSSATAKKSSP